jgi:RNA recognition motif-containing protein
MSRSPSYDKDRHTNYEPNPGMAFVEYDNFGIGNNVYVAGIPKRVNEEDLKRVFSKYGTI